MRVRTIGRVAALSRRRKRVRHPLPAPKEKSMSCIFVMKDESLIGWQNLSTMLFHVTYHLDIATTHQCTLNATYGCKLIFTVPAHSIPQELLKAAFSSLASEGIIEGGFSIGE